MYIAHIMSENNSHTHPDLVHHLLNGKLAVIPTDTIYGIAGIAKKPATIAEIYRIKHRSPAKPLIILISKVDQLADFGINLDENTKMELNSHWPGPVSILLPCPNPDLQYLHRGTNEIAFRLPDKPDLRALIDQTGPLAAPSANPENQPPAINIEEAKAYFGDQVIYLDGGTLAGSPSQLIRIHADGTVERLR